MLVSAHQAVIKHLLKEYTFIGPAPRYLLAELKGGVTVKSLYKSTWDSLRVLQAAVVETFGVSHAMYNLQINPCDFCHFATLMRPDLEQRVVDPTGFARAGVVSPTRQALMNTARVERQLICANLRIFAPLAAPGDSEALVYFLKKGLAELRAHMKSEGSEQNSGVLSSF